MYKYIKKKYLIGLSSDFYVHDPTYSKANSIALFRMQQNQRTY